MRFLWVFSAMLATASCSTSRVVEVESGDYMIEATSPMTYDENATTVARSRQEMDAARGRAIRRMNAYCAGQRRRAVLMDEAFSVQSRRSGALETAGWYGIRTLTFRCEAP